MAIALPGYAELHCLSNFSFLRGASSAEELVARAAELRYAALAITDECSVSGIVRAHVAAHELGLRLIVGAEFRLDGYGLVLLAADRDGYGNLCELITVARRRCEKGSYRVQWPDFEHGVEGCLAIVIPPNDATACEARYPQVVERTRALRNAFESRAWLGAELVCGPDDRARLQDLERLAADTGLPLVAAGDVHMHVRSRRPLQDTLTAIRLGTTVAAAGDALYPNGERHLRQRSLLALTYPAALLEQTLHIAARCHFELDSLRYEYPEELVPAGRTPVGYLRELTEAGFLWRYGESFEGAAAPMMSPLFAMHQHATTARYGTGDPKRTLDQVRELLRYELALITELGYEPYFLTVYDIVRFARGARILCQGRGSAANSAVCYCLGITEVNPVYMNVLFERFLSKERNEPPDIDVDFEHQRREEVIQYIYRKYGRDRAAIAATVITYRRRSAIRDVGKALGLGLEQVDRLAGSLAWWDGSGVLPERLAAAGFDPQSPQIARVIALVETIVGFPRHLSQHTGGFVISRGPLSRLVPIENAAMKDRSVIQWDKNDLDALGLLKVDVLALGMLSAIRRALDLIAARHGEPFTMSDIRWDDPRVYAMIQRADTVGVFQIESRAQMSMLPRLKPDKFYDLVIEVAIVRPGPIQGGMVHPYLRRKAGQEPVSYPHPDIEKVLERTLGVPIFQEQVMELAVVAAGFTPGEADRLRRAMAAWHRKGTLGPFEEKLISGMLRKGYQREFAEQVFKQIQGFGEYGFPESHSVSFALLAYASSWIKYHEPAAFLAALLNSQPMGFYAPSQLVQDARRHGVEVRAVDVTASNWESTLEPAPQSAPAVRLGLSMVAGLAEKSALALTATRAEQRFTSVTDLAYRARLNRKDMKALAAAGALAALAGDRHHAHWQVAGIEHAPPLLANAAIAEATPALSVVSEGENIVADYASVGFTLGRHPLALLRSRLTRMRLATAAELSRLPHGRRVRAAGIVTGRQRPGTASGVVFVTLEDETGHINVVVWNSLVESQHRELLGSRLMGVQGVVERQGSVVHLVAHRLFDHSALLGELRAESRDFH